MRATEVTGTGTITEAERALIEAALEWQRAYENWDTGGKEGWHTEVYAAARRVFRKADEDLHTAAEGVRVERQR